MRKQIAIAIVLCFCVTALAQVTLYGQRGLMRCYSAKTLGMGKLAVSLASQYSGDITYVRSPANPVVGMVTGDLGLSFGVAPFLDFSFDLPVYYDFLDGTKDSRFPKKLETAGQGDVLVGMKLQYPPYQHSHVFDMAYLGHVSIPTGVRKKGAFRRGFEPKRYPGLDTSTVSFYTSEKPEIDMKMCWTLDFGEITWEGQERTQIQLHTNFGLRLTTNTKLDHVFLLNGALAYSPVQFITLFTEFTGETRVAKFTKGFHIGDDPLRLTPGFSINAPFGMVLKVAADKSLSRTDTALTWYQASRQYQTRIIPDWNVVGALQWGGFLIPQDKDKDGIKDNNDRCPTDAEDLDGFQDGDGCPEPDNDNDGVLDVHDRCPNQPEEVDGFQDNDGCPDPDNDQDGVPDLQDKCPTDREDMDGFEDTDGCSDPDNDKDDVPDSLDKCPNDPEDGDRFEDEDGCPDRDNDKDGIPDTADQCPNEPENINGKDDTDGCPDDKPKKIQKRLILRGVNFKTGSARLMHRSHPILETVVEQLKAYPDVRIEIRGYTDAVGRRSYNMKLSQNRADAVKRFLMQRGIVSSRLVAVGFGPDHPIASNRTAEGRAQNRRIEFYRLN